MGNKPTTHTKKIFLKTSILLLMCQKKSYAIYTTHYVILLSMTAWTVNFCPCTTTAWTVNFVHVCMILITGPAHFFIVVIHFNVKKRSIDTIPSKISTYLTL